MTTPANRLCLGFVLACATAATGCTPRPADTSKSVGHAWQQREGSRTHHADAPAERSRADLFGGGQGSESNHEPIATVNDHPIARRRVVDLLLRSHGVGILEQLIVLDEAERLAADKGLTVSQADVDREYELALRRLTDPLSSMTSGPFDREAAERTLEAVLADRNISREEFLIGMRRHAYLRRIVESEQVLTEEQLRADFERSFGRRVQVRHIQLATPRQVDSVRQRLAAGDEFAELARAYSANTASAPAGGLLEPFSADDQDVPASFRQAAFALRPREVSDAIRVGEWYHILQLEKVIPAEDLDFEQARGEVERKLRDRLTEPAMQKLYERLFHEANIDIRDPVLKKAFETTHPNHRR